MSIFFIMVGMLHHSWGKRQGWGGVEGVKQSVRRRVGNDTMTSETSCVNVLEKKVGTAKKHSLLRHYGNNLTILCEHAKDESVDLLCLDLPFKSD
jgi:hypothetical protein